MIKRKLLIVVISLFLLSGLTLSLLAADKKNAKSETTDESQAADKNQEVVIKGVQRLKVEADKPEPDLKFEIDDVAIPYVKTEDYFLNLSPQAMDQPDASIPSQLNSNHANSPFLNLFSQAPFLNLKPRYKSKVGIAKWRLRITDGAGSVFRDFSGKGSLPKEIVWDGRSKDGKMLEVGVSYSYILAIIDVASNPTSSMGKPILLESLLYKEGGLTVATVINEVVFEKKQRRTQLSPQGELYAREIGDFLMTSKRYPLTIEVYAKDIDDAKYKGEIIQKYLGERLTLPKKRFKIIGRKDRLERVVFKIK